MSAKRLDVAAAEMIATLDPKRYVGHKHHVVPRFILQRFANDRDQVLVRDRESGARRVCNIKDLAVKDFYTMINLDGDLDSSLEQLFGVVEGWAASVLKAHLDNPFMKPRPFTPLEKHHMDGLISLQFVRGPAPRRSYELLADYNLKLVNQDVLTADDIEQCEFVPHQNEHLKTLGHLGANVEEHLATRAACVVTLDQPLLVISDEPVCLERPEWYARPTRKQLRDHPRGVRVRGEEVDRRDIIQIQKHGGVGLLGAESIAMPISPRHAVVYGPPGSAGPLAPIRLDREESVEFATEVVSMCMEQAVSWVASHPDHTTLKGRRMPPPTPIVTVFDGGTVMGRAARTSKRRSPRRLDRSAKPIPTGDAE